MPGETSPRDLGVSPGYVRLTSNNPWMNILAALSSETPRLISSDMGWEVVPRPKQVAMTIWRGVESISGQFSFWLDGFATGPVDQRLRGRRFGPQTESIAKLWEVARGDGVSQPGLMNIEGIPEFPRIDWIIESMDFEDDGSIRSENTFEQARIKCNMTVRQYVPPSYLPPTTVPAPTGSPKGKTVMWKVKKHDTPANIARKIGCKWTDIRDLNKRLINKSNQNLQDGRRIRVPATKDAIRIIKKRRGGK